MPEQTALTMPGVSVGHIRVFEYAKVLNMLQYSYNNIIIIVTVIILEFLPAGFLHPGAPQLIILSFLTRFI